LSDALESPPAGDSRIERPDIPPSELTRILRKVITEQYDGWADEPIPALSDKTPREAIATPEGREQVIDLLKLYEHGESRAALEEGREPVSYDFLWQELGLDRQRLLG